MQAEPCCRPDPDMGMHVRRKQQLRDSRVQAAQALEPAALVAMRLVRPGGSVALVGDPKQLPAIVLSQAASAHHLAQSLFERLQRVGPLPQGAVCCRLWLPGQTGQHGAGVLCAWVRVDD